MEHIPVLLKEAIEGLNISEGDRILDATFGGGGHSALICEAVGKNGKLIAFDQDEAAMSRAKIRFKDFDKCKFDLINANFRDLDEVFRGRGVKKIDGALFDLGLSSFQLDESGRGFTFQKDEPLKMTFHNSDDNGKLTAEEILNRWDEESLADIIYGYGGEQFSRRIALGIVVARSKKSIKTTFELVKIIEDSVPNFYKSKKLHCATKTFQAIRMVVNDELEALRVALRDVWPMLNSGARIVVISFHELEDRIVKLFFRERKFDGSAQVITKKPIIPSKSETFLNPRSRSAKLRIAQKI
ncbi:MAG: 16S rRNA (cytosine(1402)-N(4))-methyltransferase RsmH [Candidatus Vogelbacteria bacterium]|nr:16S rRNA (cytosine(1402)-N(4))-methyltransferase RsmH [Candidatus Vogelbacteria bacterium]